MDERERKLYLDEIFRLRTQNAMLQLQVVCLQQQVVELTIKKQPQNQQKHEILPLAGGFREVK